MNKLPIRFYRQQRNMSQDELAELTGIKQSEISTFETGVKSPRVTALYAIAEALGVTVHDLLIPREK